MNKMSNVSRIIIALGSLALIAVIFLPVWFIYLTAPQYPEGLIMYIWLDKITGQVEIINGLNHYIGMRHIKAEMFPEFQYLTYIVIGYIILGIAVAVIGHRKVLFGYLLLTILGGILAMYDYYKWGYDYGHNLDPTAAIQIPGMSYQPPLIGHKAVLNFDAYSYPDSGGWVFIGVFLLFSIVWFFEWRKNRKPRKSTHLVSKIKTQTAAFTSLIILVSCSAQPEPFVYGKDLCTECNMTIMDQKFGAEIVTKKGRVFKFDDAHCIVQHLSSGKIKEDQIAHTLFINFQPAAGQDPASAFVPATSAFFVHSEAIRSPMNSNIAAFASQEAASAKAKETNGTLLNWEQVLQKK